MCKRVGFCTLPHGLPLKLNKVEQTSSALAHHVKYINLNSADNIFKGNQYYFYHGYCQVSQHGYQISQAINYESMQNVSQHYSDQL